MLLNIAQGRDTRRSPPALPPQALQGWRMNLLLQGLPKPSEIPFLCSCSFQVCSVLLQLQAGVDDSQILTFLSSHNACPDEETETLFYGLL